MKLNTLHELIEFALANRCKFAFKDYPIETVVEYIRKAYNTCNIIYSSNELGQINGLCIFDVYTTEKRIHICQLIIKETKALKSMTSTFFMLFSANQWKLTAFRRGKDKLKVYNTVSLKNKIINL